MMTPTFLRTATARVALVLISVLLPVLGCKGFPRAFGPPPDPPRGSLDEPPPLHTGGLGVLGGGPSGPGSPFSAGPGNAVAAGLATGIGMAAAGVVVEQTVDKCLQPGASAACLRGPGPRFDVEQDAGPP
jgi:hypothetical protein